MSCYCLNQKNVRSSLVRSGFYVNLPIGGLVAIALLFIHIPDQVPKPRPSTIIPKLHHHLDLAGFVLFAGSVVQLLLALQYGGNQFPWRSSEVIGLFCGAAATFLAWFAWNYHQKDNALLPLSMISRRPVWAGALYQGLLMTVVFGGSYYLPVYFQAVKGVNAMLSGVYLLPTILTQLVMAGSSGVMGEFFHLSLRVLFNA